MNLEAIGANLQIFFPKIIQPTSAHVLTNDQSSIPVKKWGQCGVLDQGSQKQNPDFVSKG